MVLSTSWNRFIEVLEGGFGLLYFRMGACIYKPGLATVDLLWMNMEMNVLCSWPVLF